MMPKPAMPVPSAAKPPAMPVPDVPPELPTRKRWKLRDGASFPEITVFKQSGGPLWLARMTYNTFHIYGTGDTEDEARDRCEQFYLTETAAGQRDRVAE